MIQVGMKHKESVEVTWEMTAEKLGNEGVIVFSTPEMLSFLKLCRSEERRVGKECRSRWSPYH